MNKWMIWGYHYFWKHPYSRLCLEEECNHGSLSQLVGSQEQNIFQRERELVEEQRKVVEEEAKELKAEILKYFGFKTSL